MTRLLLVVALVALVAACKKSDKKAEPTPTVAAMPAEEIKRNEDACKAYVERVCACAAKVPDVAKQCELARALPDAIRIGLEVAATARKAGLAATT